MSTSTTDLGEPRAVGVSVTDDALSVELSDGRAIRAPIGWYPRLAHGTPRERGNWRFVGGGEGIHWPDLDEDISVGGLIAGRRSAESQTSLKAWLQSRGAVTS